MCSKRSVISQLAILLAIIKFWEYFATFGVRLSAYTLAEKIAIGNIGGKIY